MSLAEKKALRIWAKETRRRAARFSSATAAQWLAQAQSLAAWRTARCPCLYVAMPEEAPTKPLLENCWARGIAVVLPRITPAGLVLHKISSAVELVAGVWGILEPKENLPECAPEEIDCVIVPGLAFDAHGGRIGFGKGYYDKLLTRLRPEVARIGWAFDAQIVGHVPMAEHDVRLDWVVTPTTIYGVG